MPRVDYAAVKYDDFGEKRKVACGSNGVRGGHREEFPGEESQWCWSR